MEIKQKLHEVIEELPKRELSLLYDFVESLRLRKRTDRKHNHVPTIMQIQEMTNSDEQDWADSIIQERRDRI